jgi:DHA2 family multidrug resistance protein-like MFS transporter
MLPSLSLPFRLQHVYGFTPREIGAIIAPWPLTLMVVSPIAGILSDRYPAGVLGAIGMTIAAVAMVFLGFLPEHLTYLSILWRMVMCGAGFALFFAPNMRLVVGSAPRDRAASAGGLISTTRLTGQTLGATLVAAMLALKLEATAIPCLIGAGLLVLAGICSAARLRPEIRNPAGDETSASNVGA